MLVRMIVFLMSRLVVVWMLFLMVVIELNVLKNSLLMRVKMVLMVV